MADNLTTEQAANIGPRNRASSQQRDDRILRQQADARTTRNTTNTRNRRKSRRSPTPSRMAGFSAGSGARRRSRSRSRAPTRSRSRSRRISE